MIWTPLLQIGHHLLVDDLLVYRAVVRADLVDLIPASSPSRLDSRFDVLERLIDLLIQVGRYLLRLAVPAAWRFRLAWYALFISAYVIPWPEASMMLPIFTAWL